MIFKKSLNNQTKCFICRISPNCFWIEFIFCCNMSKNHEKNILQDCFFTISLCKKNYYYCKAPSFFDLHTLKSAVWMFVCGGNDLYVYVESMTTCVCSMCLCVHFYIYACLIHEHICHVNVYMHVYVFIESVSLLISTGNPNMVIVQYE